MSKTIKVMTLHTLKINGEFQPPGTEILLDETEFQKLFSDGAVAKYSGKEDEKVRELDYENLTLEQLKTELSKLTVDELKTYLKQMKIAAPSGGGKADLIEVLAKELKESF